MRASAQVAALTALFGLPGNPDAADFKVSRKPPLGLRSGAGAFRDASGRGRVSGRRPLSALATGNCERPRIWRRNAKVFPYLSIQLTMIGDHAESIDLKRAHGRSVVGPGKGCV
jgi:hypothetical protein